MEIVPKKSMVFGHWELSGNEICSGINWIFKDIIVHEIAIVYEIMSLAAAPHPWHSRFCPAEYSMY
jgi:hypothetical protein